jgi:hypothetical protein
MNVEDVMRPMGRWKGLLAVLDCEVDVIVRSKTRTAN